MSVVSDALVGALVLLWVLPVLISAFVVWRRRIAGVARWSIALGWIGVLILLSVDERSRAASSKRVNPER
ncbi:MAG: hypothetical protein HKL87_03375 [Acidimicrobiaceae bacterium]|nr:hypothetical protein [Acidimicrobiaceae bacterium]